ncbi:integral membrane protein [Gynuella sunshinyii]|uniref:Putative integral membrane protein n=1 Tax=Gynuella sunshinyii YC6258 TaxID=1445510 RepID=A0A0C5VCN6_9GAMM|nr:integral membrane protein [Gynuella sunshinyii]AJQ97100.1 putative integral membrane protein [Gynuella sunshinyii YC6258]
MNDVYSTPQADLTPDRGNRPKWGSLEDGINGNYEFTIGGLISEAWQRTKGAKLTINLATIIYMFVLVGFNILMQSVLKSTGSIGVFVLLQLIFAFVNVILGMGVFMIGLHYAIGGEASLGQMFSCFGRSWQIFLCLILIYLMVFLGFILLIIPGIYLGLAYYLAMPLVVEKKMSVWKAMEASRKAITKRWFSVFGLFIVLGFINLIAALPLGIGLIWTLPMSVICFSMLYRNVFGYEQSTLEAA